MYDLIIVGGGPAGMTAGIYAVRQKLNTLLITKDFGGQIAKKSVDIENYPGFSEISGAELILKLEEHLKKFEAGSDFGKSGEGIKIKKELAIKVEKENEIFAVSTQDKIKYKSKAVVIASGADPRPLEVSGEKEYIGKGVSYCALCDAAFFKGKDVVVIGGGDAGFEAALALADWAKKVYILEFSSAVMADETNQKKSAEMGKIEIITSAVLEEIKGDKFVSSVVYLDKKKNEKKNLEVQGVFVEIGFQPATSFVKGLAEFNERDEIKVDPFTGETSTPGIFAAGDVDNMPYKQIIIACGEGAKAAISAYKYIRNLNSQKK